MKKISSLIIALVVIFSLTGCGEKKVTCTMNDGEAQSKIVTTFKGKEVTNIVMENTAKVDADEVDNDYLMYQATANTFKDQTGINVSASKGKESVTLKIEMQPSKMDESLLDSMDITTEDFKNTSVEDYVNDMTEQGYTCK